MYYVFLINGYTSLVDITLICYPKKKHVSVCTEQNAKGAVTLAGIYTFDLLLSQPLLTEPLFQHLPFRLVLDIPG